MKKVDYDSIPQRGENEAVDHITDINNLPLFTRFVRDMYKNNTPIYEMMIPQTFRIIDHYQYHHIKYAKWT